MKIFVASTGRCGTLFFASVFGQLTAFPSLHEPMPFVIGRTLREVNTKLSYSPETEKELTSKVHQVQISSLGGDYMESSQMFIKGYAELMLKAFKRVIVIYLERNPMDVLLSYAEKCEGFQADWMLQSHWQKNILKTARPLAFYENVLWNWYEVKERFLDLRSKCCAHYSFRFEDLNNPIAWKAMFSELQIPHVPFDLVPAGDTNVGKQSSEDRIEWLRSNWQMPGRVMGDENPQHFKMPVAHEVHALSKALCLAEQNKSRLVKNGGAS